MQDPYSHPLHSTCTNRPRLLLRITRDRTHGGASVQVVARLPSTHAFGGLADFQVVSRALRPLQRTPPAVSEANEAHHAEPNRMEVPLLVLPPLFSASDCSFSYEYIGFAHRDGSLSMAWTPKAKQPLISFDTATPAELDMADADLANARLQDPLLLTALESLFAQRPVWMLPALLEQEALKSLDSKPAAMEAAVALLTYRFLAGPWRPALVRRGYDPRKAEDSWKYQVVTVALPDHFRNSAAHQLLLAQAGSQRCTWKGCVPAEVAPVRHQLSSSYAELVTLQHIPITKVSYFQLCDLEPSDLAALFSSGGGNDTTCIKERQQEGHAGALEPLEGAAGAFKAVSAAVDPQGFGHDRLPGGVCLNTKVHETSGWIPLKKWQKCVSCVNERVCSLIPGSSGAGGIGTGAFARQVASPAVMASFAAGDPDPALEMQAPGKSKPRRRLAGLMTSQHLSAKPPVRNALRRSQQSTKQDAQQDSVHAGKDEDAMETETAEEGHPQGAERASSCGTGEVADVQEALQLLLADLSDMTSQDQKDGKGSNRQLTE